MDVAAKIAPLLTLKAGQPAHVHEVRLDEGADGEMWIYVNAPPVAREKQRYLCFVAKDDGALAVELARHESDLADWLAQTKVQAAEYQQREAARLHAEAVAAAQAHAQVFADREAARLVAPIAEQYERESIEAGKLARAARIAARAKNEATAIEALARAAELEERATELKVQLDAVTQEVEQAKATFLATMTEKLAKSAAEQAAAAGVDLAERLAKSPPPRLTERIAELHEMTGKLVAHTSDDPSTRHILAPTDVSGLVHRHSSWMLEQVSRTGRPS